MRPLLVFLSVLFLSQVGSAACSAPSAVAGQVAWISGNSKVQWCDGTNWQNTDNATGGSCSGVVGGTINFSAGTLSYCNGANWISMKGPSAGSCSGIVAGTFAYNSGANKVRFCDGATWYDMTAITCGGAQLAGYCWYYGAASASCDTVCATHGGYNDATHTYAGASAANCAAALAAVGAAYGTMNGPAFYFGAYDCTTSTANGDAFLGTSTGSAGTGSFARRVCACNN